MYYKLCDNQLLKRNYFSQTIKPDNSNSIIQLPLFLYEV